MKRAVFSSKFVLVALVVLLCAAGVLVGSQIVQAKTSGNWSGLRAKTTSGYASLVTKYLDLSNIRIPFTNYAVFGNTELGRAGGEWPKGSGEMYIFGAGIWVGGTINDGPIYTNKYGHDNLPFTDPRVVIGYNTSGGAEEFSPLTDLYISNRLQGAAWPLDKIVSLQDSYCSFDDLNPDRFDTGPGSNSDEGPLGVRVWQTTYSWNYTFCQDIIFVNYKVTNVRPDGKPIYNCYLGVVCDPDVGPTANDDLVGFDQSRNLGYAYDSDGFEPGWAHVPGYVGFTFLESPIATNYVDWNGNGTIDTLANGEIDMSVAVDYHGVQTHDIAPGDVLGLTAFKTFNLQAGDPNNEIEKYVIMAGHNYPDTGLQEYNPFEEAEIPSDQRFLQSTGPFTLAAGDTVSMVVAIVAASTLEELQKVADQAKMIYDNHFILPSAPEHPKVTVVPGDRKVYISWENNAELSKDPYYQFTSDPTSLLYDPKYREQDFEGYRVWRSLTGQAGDWELLAQYDKTSFTPRSADITRVAGEWTGMVNYEASTVEGYILAYGGIELFTGHEYLLRVNSDSTFSISDVTLGGIALPLATEADYWYYDGDTPPSFEVFDSDMNSMVDSTGAKYFDGCYLYFGGMILSFSGPVPSEDVIFRIVGNLEKPEGENSGLRYAYVDSNLTNGVTYYYDVTAYDFQITSPHSLENGIEGIAVTPMSLATGVLEAAVFDVRHISGHSNGKVIPVVADPDAVTGHTYQVTFTDSTWNLVDKNTGAVVLADQTNQSGDEQYLVVDGLCVKVFSPPVGVNEITYTPSDNMWFSGINWGGSYLGGGMDLGCNFFGSSINTGYIKVELRFSTDPSKQQDAYVYLRRGTPSYGFVGMGKVPFTAWDVENNRQINIAFVENNGSSTQDMVWNPPDVSLGEREYLFILNSDYGDATWDANYKSWNLYDDADSFDILYAMWVIADSDPSGNAKTYQDGDVFTITPNYPNTPQDVFEFDTRARVFAESVANLDAIRVVPNPYLVRNRWEPSADYSKLQFTHLPEKCTIRIYTLAGDLVQTIEHDGTQSHSGTEDWDLLNKDKQKVTSGIYIFHVESAVGEKVGKFAIVR